VTKFSSHQLAKKVGDAVG